MKPLSQIGPAIPENIVGVAAYLYRVYNIRRFQFIQTTEQVKDRYEAVMRYFDMGRWENISAHTVHLYEMDFRSGRVIRPTPEQMAAAPGRFE